MAKRTTRKKSTTKRGKKAGRKASKKKVAKTKTKTGSRSATAKKKTAGKSSKKTRGATSKTAGRPSKSVKRRFRSAALLEQSFQIHCEAQMLRIVVSLLTGDDGSGSPARVADRAHRNALNESFCLHFRTLLDFLWEGRAGRKEAVARDFFATPRRWRPTKPQDYRDLKRRLAKEIEALTTTRYSDLSIEEWPYRRIFDEIFVDIDLFQSTVPAENLHECWREQPIAALSAEARSSTAGGISSGDVAPRSKVESAAGESEVDQPGEPQDAAAFLVGSAFGEAESSRPDWSSETADEGEEHEESQEKASVFAKGFSSLGLDED